MIKKFFSRSFKNLKSKKFFYQYANKSYIYTDLDKFYRKFLNFLYQFKNERKKIVIISEKSFEMYACIISVILSKNIWIPINANLPSNRITKILKECSPDSIIVDRTKDKKYSFLKDFCKKKKLYLQIF